MQIQGMPSNMSWEVFEDIKEKLDGVKYLHPNATEVFIKFHIEGHVYAIDVYVDAKRVRELFYHRAQRR
ncbi:MAG: hypothetical protein OEV93_04865 [Candidatus Moranbacteria bacterium]|nr:hypothetical protein [Candidatus Moranbacteria bacterium]